MVRELLQPLGICKVGVYASWVDHSGRLQNQLFVKNKKYERHWPKHIGTNQKTMNKMINFDP